MKQLSILFSGRSVNVRKVDGTEITVCVRALPLRFLVRILECAEFNHALVELCSYLSKKEVGDEPLAAPMFPDIPAPDDLVPVPAGFTDNLEDTSITKLYEVAKELNFQRAADHATGQIAAKKLVAPFREAAMRELLPVIEMIIQPLMKRLDTLSSLPASAASSSAAPAKQS